MPKSPKTAKASIAEADAPTSTPNRLADLNADAIEYEIKRVITQIKAYPAAPTVGDAVEHMEACDQAGRLICEATRRGIGGPRLKALAAWATDPTAPHPLPMMQNSLRSMFNVFVHSPAVVGFGNPGIARMGDELRSKARASEIDRMAVLEWLADQVIRDAAKTPQINLHRLPAATPESEKRKRNMGGRKPKPESEKKRIFDLHADFRASGMGKVEPWALGRGLDPAEVKKDFHYARAHGPAAH